MKVKSKVIVISFACVILIAAIGYLAIGNSVVFMNNQKLAKSVKSISSETVRLNEVVPFEWDAVYTFAPYSSKEEIETIIGFESADIKENNINEGMVHLLFVKNKKVAASILGYQDNLGYCIEFASKVTFEEDAKFNVTKTDNVTVLSYAD